MKKTMDSNKKVVLICPCCASPVDAETAGLHEQNFTCEVCDQQWTMHVDAARFAEYALS